MRKTNIQLIGLSAVLVLTLAFAGYSQENGVGAGQTGPSVQQGTQPGPGNYGLGNDGGGASPGESNRLGNTQQTAETPWGAVTLSFIIGFALGALLFRGRSKQVIIDRRDDFRDDYRRAA